MPAKLFALAFVFATLLSFNLQFTQAQHEKPRPNCHSSRYIQNGYIIEKKVCRDV